MSFLYILREYSVVGAQVLQLLAYDVVVDVVLL